MSFFTSHPPIEWTLPRCYGRAEVYAPTGTESAEFDHWAIEKVGISSEVLMENAGRGAALVVDRIYRNGPVLVVVGTGNNGGDGLVFARSLVAQGREVRVLLVGGRCATDPLLHGWPVQAHQAPEDDEGLLAALEWGGILIDALLGTGIRGEPREHHARAIRAVNRLDVPIVSLDVPSGVDADSGMLSGDAVRADLTIAFGSPKLGTLLFPGRERAGRIVALEVGFPPMVGRQIPARLITPEWARAHRPRRRLVTHKKAEGRLLILAGSSGLAGAAVLAAKGALRAGAGYVRIASHLENREILQSSVPEALFVDASDAEELGRAAQESDAIAVGPGMGVDEESAERLNGLLGVKGLSGVVLDADALTLLGDGRLPAFSDAAEPNRRLLTPHPGEMARLGADPAEIRGNAVQVCRRGAEQWAAALLLKGQPSLITNAGMGPVWLSTSGSSDLARAGIGDVLTGVAGAFLARGSDALKSGALALHFTGWAAELTGRGETLLPSDMADNLSAAFGDSFTCVSDLGLPFVTLDLDPAH